MPSDARIAGEAPSGICTASFHSSSTILWPRPKVIAGASSLPPRIPGSSNTHSAGSITWRKWSGKSPIYSGYPPAAQWPDRYFIALRGWGVEEPVVPFDVLLLPYRGARPDASVTTLECRIDGRPESPVLPRALEITAEDHRFLVIHGAPGISVAANDISFSGHTAAIEYTNDRPSKALVQRGSQLTVNGRNIAISNQPTQEIEL